MAILLMVVSLATFVLGILVAVKMFQHQMIWQGILTIICTLFGVIYGWQKKDEIGAGGLMLPYTIGFALTVVLQVMVRMSAPNAGM